MRGLIIFVLMFGLGGALAAQEVSAPDTSSFTTEVFGDWSVICTTQTSGDRLCQLSQAVGVDGDEEQAFLLNISASEDGRKHFGVVTVPLGVYLAPGVELRVDARRPFRVLYEICDVQACYAGFEVSGQALSAFRRGLDARFRVWVGRDRAVEFPVSLRGFSAAWREYERQQ
ncbi:invasion associated locus B family protein [Octadecabacter ascidiaceicola]|uniref:Invasion associated locus B (IalB) protein n=1 Tax=Octadecabacter ascidiaceicola TaxID=1655543 RepID=A0A238JNP9_9RHOB|nr:invasion associated locus B family protein [Octadecabacter ascidiaceicola]SMX31824.1 Invasion associated locus B (IalB) protein [Octadecabacter ascidiaceicola]